MLEVVPLAVAAFVSTNVDDLALLATFFAAPRMRARHVVAGQYAGIAVLVALSLAGAFVAQLVPTEYLRWLGLLPLLIGLKWLVDGLRGKSDDDDVEVRPAAGVLTVVGVTFANGGDNIGVYVPMFAGLDGSELAITVAVFALMTGVWCAVSYWVVRNPVFGEHAAAIGRTLAPFVLMAIGLAILFELL